MKSLSKISRRLNTMIETPLSLKGRCINLKISNSDIWTGSKRYAH